MDQSKNTKKPFFARLLEAQHPEEPGQNPVLGPPVHTLRHPSAEEEW